MKTLRTLLAFLFGLLSLTIFCFSANAAEHSVRFTILSYNVHGLPSWITKVDSNRFADIGKILKERKEQGNAPQVVLLQEAFTGRALELNEEAGYAYDLKGPGPGLKFFGSGLRVLSDYPIVSSNRITYGQYCGTWDCDANKGAQLVMLQVPGVPFTVPVFNTHMQSGSDYEAARVEQQGILWKFIQENSRGLPYIAGGDFNIDPTRASYYHWATLTQLQNVGEFCLDPENGCNIAPGTDPDSIDEKSHDHMYFQLGTQASAVPNVQSYSIYPVAISRPFDKPVNGRMLSDHLGYEVTYELVWDDVTP